MPCSILEQNKLLWIREPLLKGGRKVYRQLRNLTTDSWQIPKVVAGFELKLQDTQWIYACFWLSPNWP